MQFRSTERILSQAITGKREWSLSLKHTINGLHYPFYYTKNKIYSIDKLIPYYHIANYQKVYKGNDSQPKNFFWIDMVFKFDIDLKEFPYIYYMLSKGNALKNGANAPLKFYQKLKTSNPKIEFEHPALKHKDESVRIDCNELSNESINQTFEVYINKILKPYLKQLNW